MTRRFNDQLLCPYCRKWFTRETPLERWIRGQEALDSSLGIVRFDLDILMHRYLTPTDKRGTRDVQAQMFVEAKTNGADVTESQQDAFSMLSQQLRNRRTNMHREKRGRHAADHVPLSTVWSHKLKKYVRLRSWGGHLLRLSHNDPDDSTAMLWDGKPIDREELLGLLRFDLDPDTLEPTDWRRRYSSFYEPMLFPAGGAA